MGDLASGGVERRRALRVPVHGVAVFHGDAGATRGTIENLSKTGALVNVIGVPADAMLDIELKLGGDTGWVSAWTIRVEQPAHRDCRIAVRFDHLDDDIRDAIDMAIASALRAAHQRPILVIDDDPSRRRALVRLLALRGMTPLAPRTPLEAIDLLSRVQLHVDVCLLAPSFGHTTSELRALVAESFPWVTAAEISNELDDTVERAEQAWLATAVGKMPTS